MNQFGSLSGKVESPFRVVLIDPATDDTLKDRDGKEAYIDVLSAQSEAGRKFDRERDQQNARKAMRQQVSEFDQLQTNIAKLSALTVGWHLVDPVSKAPIEAPFGVDVAREFYALPLAYPFYLQAWLAAHATANFIRSSSTT